MQAAVREALSFINTLFPDEDILVYVPPSNILSEEGREVLNKTSIRNIASFYLSGDLAYEQEFGVSASDGIIDTPRVISGYVINDFTQLVALSELNYHLVSTHFQHPDDVLDEDRGAALGWETLFGNFSRYVEWLYTSFPEIRNLTGTELAAAVQRYDLLRYTCSETEDGMELQLQNFLDEAWMMLRLNNGQAIEEITGADYCRVAENLYLPECHADHISIRLE